MSYRPRRSPAPPLSLPFLAIRSGQPFVATDLEDGEALALVDELGASAEYYRLHIVVHLIDTSSQTGLLGLVGHRRGSACPVADETIHHATLWGTDHECSP